MWEPGSGRRAKVYFGLPRVTPTSLAFVSSMSGDAMFMFQSAETLPERGAASPKGEK
jgi:hypothetical protein